MRSNIALLINLDIPYVLYPFIFLTSRLPHISITPYEATSHMMNNTFIFFFFSPTTASPSLPMLGLGLAFLFFFFFAYKTITYTFC